MESIKGYRVFPLALNAERSALHSLYVKEHSNKNQPGSVLFVGNIDYLPELTILEVENFLRKVFENFGEVKSVAISNISEFSLDDDNTTRFAYIHYQKKVDVKKMLQLSHQELHDLLFDKVLKKYLNRYQQPTSSTLRNLFMYHEKNANSTKTEIDQFMRDYELREQEEKAERERKANEPDDDGFITVQKRKRPLDEEVANNTKQQPNKKKKGAFDLKNFYRFQIREEKMQQLNELRKKFEEDKEKLAKMKEARKFKPF